MFFQFSTFNHCRQGQIIVEDVTTIMGHQLMALDHEVRWDNGPFSPAGYNVVLESFADDPDTIRQIGAAHRLGCRFLYVATEEPTPEGFNHNPAMLDRQNAFPAAAEFASCILCLVPGQHVTDWYSQFAPSVHVELGYARTLVHSDVGPEPMFDFGFYGQMTWRREQMLAHLEKVSRRKVLRLTTIDVPRLGRDVIMRQAKVVVQIRPSVEALMVSSSRCATALNLGRPVVAEPHRLSSPWDEVVHFAPTFDRFYDDAIAATNDWRGLHHEQIISFEKRLTPEACIGEPLRQIGMLP